MTAQLSTRSNQRQMLDLVGGGSAAGPRKLALAYLAEAPVWRASYRLLMHDSRGAEADLQAWALVHNDTDEPWRDVHVELIFGRPTSFLYPVTAPRYERRDLETPEQELSSVPQLSTTTADALWGDFSDYEGESVGRVGSPEGVTGYGSGAGYGSGSGSGFGGRGKRASSARVPTASTSSDLLWVGDLSQHVQRVGRPKRTDPVFKLAHGLDLAPQHSAMVPFLEAPLHAAPVVWFSGFNASSQRAVAISNTTPHPLPAGPLAVYGDDGFLGEALLNTLQPGGRQFAQIGDEPDTSIHAGPTLRDEKLRHVDFRAGELRVHSLQTSTTKLSFGNQTGRPQQAYVALSIATNAAVQGADGLDFETTSHTPFAVFELPVGISEERSLVSTEALRRDTPSEAVTHEELQRLITTEAIPEHERDVLRRSLAPLVDWTKTRDAAVRTREQTSTIRDELSRLREDLRGLRSEGSGSAHAPLMQRIFDREDGLARLEAQLLALEEESRERKIAFEAVLGQLEAFREDILGQRKAARGAAEP